MADLKKQLKKVLGLVSTSLLLFSLAIGILTKEKNNSQSSSNRPVNQDYQFEDSTSSKSKVEVEKPTVICKDLLEKDENLFTFEEYTKAEVVECMYVGCGGIF